MSGFSWLAWLSLKHVRWRDEALQRRIKFAGRCSLAPSTQAKLHTIASSNGSFRLSATACAWLTEIT